MTAIPIRHPEKTAKFEIAHKLGYRPSREDRERILFDWTSLTTSIKQGRDAYVAKARAVYSRRDRK